MAITSLVFKLPNADAVTARLLQNASEMGDSLKPFYGNRIGDIYGNLINEHLIIAADLVKATLAGDQATAAIKEREWYKNADQIVTFLNRINPYIRLQEARDMFYMHLDLTKKEAIYMANKEYEKDIATYDASQEQGSDMADMLTEAIIKQFPHRFM